MRASRACASVTFTDANHPHLAGPDREGLGSPTPRLAVPNFEAGLVAEGSVQHLSGRENQSGSFLECLRSEDWDMRHAGRSLGIIREHELVADRGAGTRLEARSAPSLLARLERAQAQLSELIDGFDGLPEAYVSGSRNWTSLRELETACELISSAHSDLIGG